MKSSNSRKTQLWEGTRQLTTTTLVLAGFVGIAGCLDRPVEPIDSRRTSTIIERLTQSKVDKIDLLLSIDNSGSMADKQAILALAVPDLIEGLVNPPCIDPKGDIPAVKPKTPTEDCPAGLTREFEPVLDIHIGIISSSLGGHGTNACNDPQRHDNDRAHLLTRSSSGSTVETYQDKGFLAWDPAQKLDPEGSPEETDPGDGEADVHIDDENPVTDLNDTALVPQLREMVLGVGQIGCGYESQLESWYRFLVDPDPYDSIDASETNKRATLVGTDSVVLEQRADFLRPDSLLAVVLLSDENDCSVKEGAFGHIVVGSNPMWRPRSECAVDPNDPCCLSCGQPKPDQCPEDPTCDLNGGVLTPLEDAGNLRCFDQKRRFGIDFLYPVERYVKGLTDSTVPNRQGDLVPNPIFSNLNPQNSNATIRDPGRVFLAGIVGVPWQDIARQNEAGQPDLLNGLDKDGRAVGGLKSAEELARPTADGNSWDMMLGDPQNQIDPQDPFMIESPYLRIGTNPITQTPITYCTPSSGTNEINGCDWGITLKDDLQYACIFPLPPGEERDCSAPGAGSCDCKDPEHDVNNPLCAPNPNDNNRPTLQVRAKAYPGLRQLEAIKGLGDQGIVGSVCPAQIIDPDSRDYGYGPAIGAIVERLKSALPGQCLPRTLTPRKDGSVSCAVLEARNSEGSCSCDSAGRQPVSTEHAAAVSEVLSDATAQAAGWDCVCEVVQISDEEERDACMNSVEDPVVTTSGEEVNGWCYIDATTVPPTGNPEIVQACPSTERRLVRFVGKGEVVSGATAFIICNGDSSS